MPKQLNVNLAFTADTSQAKKQLQELQKTLNDLTTQKPNGNFGFTQEIQKASTEVLTLKNQLKEATDVKTGKLDLGKFNQSIKNSGMSLEKYKNTLVSMGPAGVQAFAQLTQAINNAEMPLRRTNKLMSEFAVTLKNAAKWQISSSILHGFMGTLQGAYRYAQDLDASLNNIRIVTGNSKEEMAKFANEANKAAKSLSTTTTAYTDAALIYYQQGLDDNAVKERTDATIKMANVTGQSATEVSSYMTAIWNNFADGSHELEYYADVITALGAATASSSAEISEGLEKFASIGETVGLSYEYATAALATVVAQTRQSADVVGTAFKTIFARLQGLSLGETLDDGTDLNKYSKALETVGVSIKNANGEVKKMDDILDELGEKWNMISKDEQIALAQTVAGTRQYAQLVALMENWDKVKSNINIAENSEGSLQRQADIYAESWQAARKRVQASLQGLYDHLLDDDFFIELTNNFAKLIEGIDKLVQSFGGMKGVLLIVSNIMLKTFNSSLTSTFTNIGLSIKTAFTGVGEATKQAKQEANDLLIKLTEQTGVSRQVAESYQSQATAQKILIDNSHSLSESQQQIARGLLDQQSYLAENVRLRDEEYQKAKQTLNIENTKNIRKASGKVDDYSQFINQRQQVTNLDTSMLDFESNISNMTNAGQIQEQFTLLKQNFEEMGDLAQLFGEEGKNAFEKLSQEISKDGITVDEIKEKIRNFSEVEIQTLYDGIEINKVSWEKFSEKCRAAGIDIDVMDDLITKSASKFSNLSQAAGDSKRSIDGFEQSIKSIKDSTSLVAQGFTDMVTGLSSLAMGIMSIKNLGKIWDNDDLSTGEKILQTMISMSMVMNTLTGASKISEGFSKIGKKIKKDKTSKKDEKNKLTSEISAQKEIKEKSAEELETLKKEREKLEEELGKKVGAFKRSREEIEKELEEYNKDLEILKENEKGKNKNKKDIKKKYGGEGKTNKEVEDDINKKIEDDKKDLENLDTINEKVEEAQNNFNAANEKIEETQELFDKLSSGEGLKGAVNGIKNLGTSLIGAAKSAMAFVATPIGAAVTALAATVAIAAYYFDRYNDSLQNAVETAEEESKAAEEKVEQLKKEKEEIDELSKKYNELMENSSNLSREELKIQSYQLCLQYNDESLALKALAGDYDAVTEAIEKNKLAKAGELEEASDQSLEAKKNEVYAKSKASASGWQKYKNFAGIQDENTVDVYNNNPFSGGSGENSSQNKEYRNKVSEIYAKNVMHLSDKEYKDREKEIYNKIWRDSGHIERGALNELGALAKDEILEASESIGGEIANSVEKYLVKHSADLSELSNEYAQNAEQHFETGMERILSNKYSESSDYIKDVRNLKEEMISLGMSAEVFDEKFNHFLSSIDTNANKVFATYSKLSVISSSLFGEKYSEEQYNQLKDLTDDELEIVAANSKLIKTYIKSTGKTVQNWITENDSYLKSIEHQNRINSVKLTLEAATKNGKFTKEDIDKLFDEDNYIPKIKVGIDEGYFFEITKEVFSELDFGSQSLVLANSLLSDLSIGKKDIQNLNKDLISSEQNLAKIEKENNAWLEKTYDENKINKIRKENQAEIQRLYVDAGGNNNADSLFKVMGISYDENGLWQIGDTNISKDNKISKKTGKALEKINKEYVTPNTIPVDDQGGYKIDSYTLTDEGKKYIENQNRRFGSRQRTADAQDRAKDDRFEAYEGEAEKIANLKKQIKESEITYEEWTQALEAAKQAVVGLNQNIDNMQSAYQALSSVIKEYNSTGKLSVDNIQALLAMDDKYLACLRIKDGQYQINNNTMKEMLEIQKNEMKHAATLQFLSTVGALAKQEEAIAAGQAAISNIQLADSMGQATEAAKKGLPELQSWVSTLVSAQGISINSNSKEYREALEAYRNRLLLIDKMSTSGFDKSSTSSKNKKQKDKEFEDEFDRYYQYKKAIKSTEKALEKLNKQQDELINNELIQSLELENKLLEEQKNNYKALGEEQKKEQSELQTKLGSYGMNFSDSGMIKNYNEVTSSEYVKYIEAINAHNAGSITDKDFEKAEKHYEKFKKELTRYDALMKEIDDRNKNDEEARKEIVENNLKVWDTKVKISLETREAERDWNDFLNNISEDFTSFYQDFGKQMSHLAKQSLTFTDSKTIDKEIQAIKDIEAEIDKMMAGGRSNMFDNVSSAQKKLKEYYDKLTQDTINLKELTKEAYEAFLSSIDQADTKLGKLTDKFSQIASQLEFEGELIGLLYGDKAYNSFTTLYDAQTKNALNNLNNLKQQNDMWTKLYNNAAEGSKEQEKYYNKMLETQNALNKATTDYIKLLKDEYLNSVNKIIDSVKKKLTNGMGLDRTIEQWDMAKRKAQGFYDETERIYQIQTMTGKWQKLLNDTTGQKAQNMISKAMSEQVDYLESKTRLSEYDIGLAEKELEITRAQIALEEAQNAKNSLKVTRGTDGNWSYQYVADDDNTADKQQALLDKINDKYEYIKNKNQESLDNLLTLTEEYWTKYYEIQSDTTLNDEEKALRLNTLYQDYYGEEGLLTNAYRTSAMTEQQLSGATLEVLQANYDINKDSYNNMTDAQKLAIEDLRNKGISSYEELRDSVLEDYQAIWEKGEEVNLESLDLWETTAKEMSDIWNADDGTSVKSSVLNAMEECNKALELYNEKVEEASIVTGISFGESGIAGDIQNAKNKSDELNNSISELISKTLNDIVSCNKTYMDMANLWSRIAEKAREAAGAVAAYLDMSGKIDADSGESYISQLDAKLKEIQDLMDKYNSSDDTSLPEEDIKKQAYYENYGNGTYVIYDENGKKIRITGDKGEIDKLKKYDPNTDQIYDYYGYEREHFYSDKLKTGYKKQEQVKQKSGSDKILFKIPGEENSSFPGSGIMVSDGQQVVFTRDQWTEIGNAATNSSSREAAVIKIGAITGSDDSKFNDAIYEYIKNNSASFFSKIESLATGGYTGEWANGSTDGRLAFLHQKELVLNASDTENILSAVSTIRDLASVNSNMESAIAEGIAQALVKITSAASNGNTYSTSNTTNNSSNVFNVNADFSGLQDAAEIKNALLNLPNLASQAIGRRSI